MDASCNHFSLFIDQIFDIKHKDLSLVWLVTKKQACKF